MAARLGREYVSTICALFKAENSFKVRGEGIGMLKME